MALMIMSNFVKKNLYKLTIKKGTLLQYKICTRSMHGSYNACRACLCGSLHKQSQRLITRCYVTLSSNLRKTPLVLSRSYSIDRIPPDEIKNVFSKKNKDRVINDLKLMKPNKTLIESCQSEAAVLVPFCTVDNKPSLLFTLRSKSLFKHGGEVSFPGGKRDKEDNNLVETAVRETVEELGIQSDKVEVWGCLTPMPDRLRRVAITPVLGYLGEVDVKSIPFSHHEVSEVFSLTFKHALEHRKFTNYKSGARLPVFTDGPHRVWGITAMITERVFKLMFPDKYKTSMRPFGFKHLA